VFQPGLVDDSRSSGGRRQRPRSDNSTASHDSPFFFVAPQRHWRASHCNESLHSNRGDGSCTTTEKCSTMFPTGVCVLA